MMKISFSIAALLYGASAVRLGHRGPPKGGEEGEGPIPKEMMDCLVDLGVEGREAVRAIGYCYCDPEAEGDEQCGGIYD